MKNSLFLSIKKVPKLTKNKIIGIGKGSSKTFKVVSLDVDPNGAMMTFNEKYLYFKLFSLYFMLGIRKRAI